MYYVPYSPPIYDSGTSNLLNRLDTVLFDLQANRIKLLPASVYSQIPSQELLIWMQHRQRYCLPTIELINWLKTRIADRPALEIGADHSDLAFYLGIRAIGDCHASFTSYPTVLSPGQIPTRVFASDVHRMDAIQAIYEFRPEIVIGAWIPDKFSDNFGSKFKHAPNEYQIVQNADYIHIGSEKSHSRSKMLEFPHEALSPPGLVSRTSVNPPDDIVHIWKKLQ